MDEEDSLARLYHAYESELGGDYFGLPFHPNGDCKLCSDLDERLLAVNGRLHAEGRPARAVETWGRYMNQIRGGSLHLVQYPNMFLVPTASRHGRPLREVGRTVAVFEFKRLADRADPSLGVVPFFENTPHPFVPSSRDVAAMRHIRDTFDFAAQWPEGSTLYDKGLLCEMALDYHIGVGPLRD